MFRNNSTVSISLTDNGTKLRHNYNGRLLGGPTKVKPTYIFIMFIKQKGLTTTHIA